MRSTTLRALALAGAGLVALAGAAMPASDPLDRIAVDYVNIVLRVGQHDPDYVDAYYGPPEWKLGAEQGGKLQFEELVNHVNDLLRELDDLARTSGARRDDGSRWAYLVGQLESVKAHLGRLAGKRYSFDEEALALYQARPPQLPLSHFEAKLAALGALLPPEVAGAGSVPERYQRYRARFVVPKDRLDAVFSAAIAEARKRTLPHVTLPPGESFTVEYVSGKPWSGYNWYQGGGRSLIQVNTDLPIYIDRALDLAAHEGYPGHHAYNALLEQHLAKPPPAGRGWVEFSVYPLFSPQSLIAEGTANLGVAIAFPGAERARFEREVLFPLAGLDPAEAERYARVQQLAKDLAFAGNEAARRYLDGRADRAATVDHLVRFALKTPAEAEQRVRFIEKYRSYVINYNVGERMAEQWVTRRAGSDPAARWKAFVELLSSPRLPASLAK